MVFCYQNCSDLLWEKIVHVVFECPLPQKVCRSYLSMTFPKIFQIPNNSLGNICHSLNLLDWFSCDSFSSYVLWAPLDFWIFFHNRYTRVFLAFPPKCQVIFQHKPNYAVVQRWKVKNLHQTLLIKFDYYLERYVFSVRCKLQ